MLGLKDGVAVLAAVGACEEGARVCVGARDEGEAVLGEAVLAAKGGCVGVKLGRGVTAALGLAEEGKAVGFAMGATLGMPEVGESVTVFVGAAEGVRLGALVCVGLSVEGTADGMLVLAAEGARDGFCEVGNDEGLAVNEGAFVLMETNVGLAVDGAALGCFDG